MRPMQRISRGMLSLHRKRPGLDRLLLVGAFLAAAVAFLIGIMR